MRAERQRWIRGRSGLMGGVAVLSLAALWMVPIMAQAQDKSADKGGNTNTTGKTDNTDSAGLADKKVSLDAERMPLAEAIKKIMSSVKADYVIDDTLAGATITAHLTDVRLSVMLDTLVRVSSLPVTYTVEKGVYHFTPRAEPTTPPPGDDSSRDTPPVAKPWHYEVIRVNYVDAGELARFLGGSGFTVGGQSYGVVNPSNALTSPWGNGTMTGYGSFSSSTFNNGQYFSNGGSVILDGSGRTSTSTSTSRGGGGMLSIGPFHFPIPIQRQNRGQ